jgi:hypothetical protein
MLCHHINTTLNSRNRSNLFCYYTINFDVVSSEFGCQGSITQNGILGSEKRKQRALGVTGQIGTHMKGSK